MIDLNYKKAKMTKIIAKIAGAVSVVALAAVVAVPSASALTQAQVDSILSLLTSFGADASTIANVEASLTGGTPSTSGSSSSSSCASYTRDLTLGSTGADVVSLQTMLESKGFLTIPTGVSKGYFGALTKSALASYQAAMGISPASGYFGPITRSSITCTTTSTDGGSMDDDDDNELSGGEASLTDYAVKSTYSNENLEEGEEKFVFQAEFDVKDGDAEINRIDVKVQAVDESLEDDPWRQIETLTLYVNGDEVASKDVDDEDEWSREATEADVSDSGTLEKRSYQVRFSGLDIVAEEDDEVSIEIEVKVRDDIDDSNLEQSWAIWIPSNGVRARDGAGIDQYTGGDASGDIKEFDIEAVVDGTLEIQKSGDDPDSSILVVGTQEKSDEFEVFIFELDNENADIFLNDMWITASSSNDGSASISNIVSELKVEIDGETYEHDTASTTAGSYGEYKFTFQDNDEEVPVGEDERVDVIVKAVFNQQVGNYDEGSLVSFGIGSYTTTSVNAEGQQSGDATTVTGYATSSTHTLRAAGINVEGVSESATVDEPGYSGGIEWGIFQIEVEITALDDDVWIPDGVSTSASTGAGFVFSLQGDVSDSTWVGTTSATIVSKTVSTSKDNNRYRIDDDDSERFTIEVQLDPNSSAGNSKFTSIKLDKIRFATSSTNTLVDFTLPDETEFQTDQVKID
jgi:hypothetical protein